MATIRELVEKLDRQNAMGFVPGRPHPGSDVENLLYRRGKLHAGWQFNVAPPGTHRPGTFAGSMYVDLFHPGCGIIVEIDGEQHRDARDEDDLRDAICLRAGYTVRRIPARIVRQRPRHVERWLDRLLVGEPWMSRGQARPVYLETWPQLLTEIDFCRCKDCQYGPEWWS